MKRMKTKKLLAAMLSVVLLTLQTGQVFAAKVNEPVAADETVSADEAAVETPAAEEALAGDDELTVTDEEETGADEVLPEEEVPVSEDAAEAFVSDDETARILSYNLKGMDEGFVLSEDQKYYKEQIRAHEVVSRLSEMTEGVDYVENQVIFTAESEEYAEQVARSYNAELVSCEYGVAVIKLDPERVTVAQAVEAGASEVMTNLVPVNPNFITCLDDPVETGNASDEDGLSSMDGLLQINAAKKKTGRTLDWEYWYNKFKDPYLDPWKRLDNPDSNRNGMVAGQWFHDAIGTYQAWGVTTGKSSVRVAVIDSGVYENSTDLKGKVDELPGWYKIGDTVDGGILGDGSGHGTHVAGIIAATAGNGFGGAGVAPGVRILKVPVFYIAKNNQGLWDDAGASDAVIARAIKAVADSNMAQVINMSLGGTGYDSTCEEAVKYAHDKGISICVSMGNDNTNQINFPAGFPGVIAVVSSDRDNSRSDFSSYGSHADISAPGSLILSTHNGHDTGKVDVDVDTLEQWNGTSMACPVVAGAVALYISATGETDPDKIEKLIKQTATKGGSNTAAGIINVAAMMPDDTEKPGLFAVDKNGRDISSSEVPEDAFLKFSTPETAKGGTIGYVFTFDGTDPKVENGLLVNGTELGTGVDTYPVQDLVKAGIVVGSPATIKVMRINARGTASDIYTGSVTINGTKAETAKSVTIKGPKKVAPGKSVTYSAKINPSYVKSGIKWELRDNPAGVTVNKNGKVSVKKGTSGTFKIVAVADDAAMMEAFLDVTIADPAKAVTVTAVTDKLVNIPVEKNGSLTSVRMYTADCVDTPALDEKVLQLKAQADNGAGIAFSSSKKAVAEVDETGKITAHKAGNTVITCMANDGSGKKVKVKVKVIVPSSIINIVAKNGQSFVAYGKSLTLNPAFGENYGKPTVKKADWKIDEIRGVGSSGTVSTITEQAKGFVTVKNGKVSVKKNIRSLGYEMYYIRVKASSTDGTDDSATRTIFAIAPATVCRINWPRGKSYLQFVTDCGVAAVETGVYKATGMCEPVVSSSNPKAFGGHIHYEWEKAQYQGKQVIVWYVPLASVKGGKSTINVKLNDGSGKKSSYTLIAR